MSTLFAFRVSEFVECLPHDGAYDMTAQMWVGESTAVARGYTCFSSGRACERALIQALKDGCAVFQTSCTGDATNGFCYYNLCS